MILGDMINSEKVSFHYEKAILLMASDGHSTGYIRPLPSPLVLLLEVYLHMLYLKYLILYFILIFVYKLHHIDRSNSFPRTVFIARERGLEKTHKDLKP